MQSPLGTPHERQPLKRDCSPLQNATEQVPHAPQDVQSVTKVYAVIVLSFTSEEYCMEFNPAIKIDGSGSNHNLNACHEHATKPIIRPNRYLCRRLQSY